MANGSYSRNIARYRKIRKKLAYRSTVLKLLLEIKAEQHEVKAGLDLLNQNFPTSTLPLDCPQFPVNSFESLELLDNYLREPENFRKTCNFFRSVGGDSVKAIVRRILQSIMTNNLSTKYNWKGLGGEKMPFCQLIYVISMISTSVRQHAKYEDTTDHEIEDCIKKWLMHAKDRDGGRTIRALKKSIQDNM